MTGKEMMERYIYEVTKRVPQETREEIRMELISLIEDMCEGEGLSMEDALKKLGDPAEFAKRYRDDNNYLIGPEYYDNFIWVIKIALIGIGISAVVSACVNGLTNAESWADIFTDFFNELITAAVNGIFSMVGIVTVIFAILEHQKIRVDLKPKKNWSVDDLSANAVTEKIWSPLSLPPVPDKRALIGRGDTIFSIIFISVFAALLLFAPEFFGAFYYDGTKLVSSSCIFNLNDWGRILPLLLFSLFVGLVDEIIRLVTGYYCKIVMYSSIICGVIQMIAAVILIKFIPMMNADFALEIIETTGRNKYTSADILNYWGSDVFNNVFLFIICMISLIEISVSVYRTLKYSNQN